MSGGKVNRVNKQKRDPILNIYFAKRNYRQAINLLKTSRSYTQAKGLLQKLGLNNPHPDLRSALLGATEVTDWNNVLTSPLPPPSQDWLQELGWLAHGFIKEATKLNSFLDLRKQFGRAYLLANYAEADQILSKVDSAHGVSLWVAERHFMLLQAKEGFAAHKAYLSAIQSTITNPLVGYFVTTVSDRLEPHVSHESYLAASQQVLKSLREEGFDEFASWIELHISPWTYAWLKDRHGLLYRCIGTPLIDRYDRAIKILSCISLVELSESEKGVLRTIVSDMREAISDRTLEHLLTLLESKPRAFDQKTEGYLNALDLFVSGDYANCAKAAETLILYDPTCFQFYWLMARANACLSEERRPSFSETSYAGQIFSVLFKVAENKVALQLPLLDLTTIALALGDNHLGISLWQFSSYEIEHAYDLSAITQAIVQAKIDYFDTFPAQSVLPRDIFSETVSIHYSDHVSVRLARFEKSLELEVGELKASVSAPLFAIANAKRHAMVGKFAEVLFELRELRSTTSTTRRDLAFHSATAAPLEFEALVELDQVEAAAAAVIQHYIHNRNVLRHVPFEALIEGGCSGRWPILRRLVSWPILVFLNNGGEQDIYEAVDDLLIEHNCSSPLAIADGKIPCSAQELRIILRDVLSPRVIARGALWNRTAEERRSMRKQILQKLYSISVDDQSAVVEELSRIEQAQLLETAYRNVEGPKFNLNYAEVNRHLPIMLDGFFARYVEHRGYEDSGGTLATESEFLDLAKEGINSKPASDRKRVTSDFLLRQMLIFAYLNYLLDVSNGINASLGNRVRHGALENQLTRVFGAHCLLAIRGVSGDYRCDSKWDPLLASCSDEKREILEQAIFVFTKTIAELLDSLITSCLRIRIPENVMNYVEGQQQKELRTASGLLDFGRLFSQATVDHFKNARLCTLEEFLLEAERSFVSEAHSAFANVQHYFENDVAEAVNTALSNLDTAVLNALPEGAPRGALRAGILSSKGEFIQDLRIMINWFSAASQSAVGVSSMSEVISMASKVVNFASNGKLGPVEKLLFQDVRWAPEVGMLMYEVVSILLRNVAQHSGLQTDQGVQCEHRISPSGRVLILRNRVVDHQKYQIALQKAKQAVERPFDEWVLSASPGGTGFLRIRKLLKQAGYSKCEIYIEGKEEAFFEVQIHYDV